MDLMETSVDSQKLPKDKRLDADAAISVRGSPSGAEFELRITEGPEVDVAHAKPETHIELLEEDQTGEVRMCGYLIKAMYETRQAASAR